VILLVDNYDSFTYNLAHLFAELGAEVDVRRNDVIDADEAEELRPSHLVISPGPGRPAESGATLEIVTRLAGRVPMLGVCLGHQAIVEVFGGEIGPARQLVHGKSCTVQHDGRGHAECDLKGDRGPQHESFDFVIVERKKEAYFTSAFPAFGVTIRGATKRQH